MLKLCKTITMVFILTFSLSAQNTFQAEYFFDFDPGPGHGTAVSASGDSVFSFSADKSNLTAGFHIIYVRTKNASGLWSHHVLKPFIVSPDVAEPPGYAVNYAEYFFDKDPGFGNGAGMPLTASTNTEGSFTINKSQLMPGFHTFYVRARDVKWRWTTHIAKPFLVTEPVNKKTSGITALKYYFYKDGAPSDTFTVSGFETGTDIEISFQPDFTGLLQDSSYDFHVFTIDSLGRRSLNFVFGDQLISDIEADELTVLVPKTLELKANYPNPFNPSTVIEFGLPQRQNVQLVIYDIIGRKVTELVNKTMEAGYHKIEWNGKNGIGEKAASGFYVYRVLTDQKELSRKMVLLK